MTTDSEKKTFLAKNQPPAIELDKTICIEWFRLGSFIALAALFVAAKIFSSKFVFYPDEDLGIGSRSLLSSLTDKVTSFLPEGEESGRFLSSLRGAVASATATGEEGRNLGDTGSFVLFGQEHPYINMRETVIFKTFGLPHTCSYIDFNPAKEIGAILLPLFSFPMTVFLILAHYRNQLVYVNDPQNEEAKSLYKFSRFATYFSVIVIQLTHLWFVNDPQESYPKAVGFVGHYIPYALFQTALVVIAMMQVKYDIVTKSIPYGVSKGMARFYVVYLGILTFVYQAVVVAVLMDNPIIDARNGGWEATVFQILVKLYALSSLLVPIACSVWTIRYSGDTNSFKMAIQ